MSAAHLRFADAPDAEQRAALATLACGDPRLMPLLRRLRELRLPQVRLVSGAVYQGAWNALSGRPAGYGIKDYDVIYFDADDLSYEAEDRVIRRVAAQTADLGLPVETRNQARVHLWFERRFGTAYSPLADADESLTRYAARVHAVGIRLREDDSLDIAAPFGLGDLFSFVVRPNRALSNAGSYSQKAARVKALWPEVSVLPW